MTPDPQPIPEHLTLSLQAAAVAVFFSLLFGANAVAVKAALAGFGVFFLAGFRFATASVVLILWAIIRRQSLKVRKDQIPQVLIFSTVFTCQLALFYLGVSLSNASRATLIINLQPFFVMVLAHFFIPGDTINRKKLLAVLLGVGGILFVFLEKSNTAGEMRIGDLIILGAALCWAVNTVYIKRVIDDYHPVQIAIFPMAFSSPLLIAASLITGETFITELNTTVVLSFLYQSLITASIGFLVWNTLLKKYGAVNLHFYGFLVPVSGVLFGALLLDEPVTAKIIVAMVLVAAGLIISHIKRDRPPLVSPLGRSV